MTSRSCSTRLAPRARWKTSDASRASRSSSAGTTSRQCRSRESPTSDELDELKKVYFSAWPDGVERQSWKDITYVRVRPTWARYSDFRPGGEIVEVDQTELRSWRSS